MYRTRNSGGFGGKPNATAIKGTASWSLVLLAMTWPFAILVLLALEMLTVLVTASYPDNWIDVVHAHQSRRLMEARKKAKEDGATEVVKMFFNRTKEELAKRLRNTEGPKGKGGA